MYEWDEHNSGRIGRHDVTPSEAEEALESNPLFLEYHVENGEGRYREIGETRKGRILVVVSTFRNDRTRVITSYDPSATLRAIYLTNKEAESNGEEDRS